jgi:hypothetical protein
MCGRAPSGRASRAGGQLSSNLGAGEVDGMQQIRNAMVMRSNYFLIEFGMEPADTVSRAEIRSPSVGSKRITPVKRRMLNPGI